MNQCICLGVLLLSFIGASAQIDDEFWFVAPEVYEFHEDSPIRLRFATFDDAAQVTVDMPANPGYLPYTLDIEANSALTLDLTDDIDLYENRPFNSVLDKGIHITSTADISCYYEVGQLLNPDIFALKGDNALGTSFHLPFQDFGSNPFADSPSGFDVVATVDNTVITITPTTDLIGHPAGIPFDVVLPFAGSTYSARAADVWAASHPVGTTITSNHPIAVTIHDDSVASAVLFGSCLDLMGDQMVPDHILGTEYIAVHGYLFGDDRLQFVAIENNTEIMVDGNVVAVLSEGQSHEHVLVNSTAYIESTAPIAVWQTTGFGCEFGGALLPSVRCTGSQSTVFVRSTSEAFRLNVLVPAGGEGNFTLGGNPNIITASDFSPVPGNPDWMFSQDTTLGSIIQTGVAYRLENGSHVFHLGLINGGASSGTRFGYFSDYGSLKYQAVNQLLEPCVGDPLVLEVNPVEDGLYQWSGPGGFAAEGLVIDLGNAAPSDAGTYVVSGYNGACPIEDDTLEVIVHEPLPPLVVSEDIVTCVGQSITFEANAEGVQWSGPGGFQSSGPVITLENIGYSAGGYYVAGGYDPHCPSNADSVLVEVGPADVLVHSWTEDVYFCQGGSVTLVLPNEVEQTEIIQWTFEGNGGGAPTSLGSGTSAVVSETGTVTVTASTPPPCIRRSEGVFHLFTEDCHLLVPNIITPDNRPANNSFTIANLGQFPNSSIRIFDRWGTMVYSHEDFGSTGGWNPGAEQAEGTYFFTLSINRNDERISITTIHGTTEYVEPGPILLTGRFMLLR